jgi:hypothetical protein
VATSLAIGSHGATPAYAKPVDYSGLSSDDYLGDVEVLAKVEAENVFTEGPAVDFAGTVLFTNVPESQILKWDPRKTELSVYRDNTNETNGLYFAPDGSLLACEGGSARVTRTDAQTGKIEVLADGYGGKRLAKPNDLCTDGKGRVYFTSRSAVEDPAGDSCDLTPRQTACVPPDTRGHHYKLHIWRFGSEIALRRLRDAAASYPDADCGKGNVSARRCGVWRFISEVDIRCIPKAYRKTRVRRLR